jgi:hypothetical protein
MKEIVNAPDPVFSGLISDETREKAVEFLRLATEQGYLTPEQFSARIGSALEARNTKDLRPALRDLPSAIARDVPEPGADWSAVAVQAVRATAVALVTSFVWALATRHLMQGTAGGIITLGLFTALAVVLALASFTSDKD